MGNRYFTDVCVQLKPGVFEEIPFVELLRIRETNESLYISVYQDELYCPDCKKAKLAFTYGVERKYLSANDATAHDKEICDRYYESASKQIIAEYIKQKSPQEIHNQLLRLLGKQKDGEQVASGTKNQQQKNLAAKPITFSPTNSAKTYSIPRQKIGYKLKGVDDFKEELFKYYYGVVKVKKVTKKHNSTGTWLNLYLYSINTNYTICSLSIKQLDVQNKETNIWHFIKNTINQLVDDNIYEVAFCGEMKSKEVYNAKTKQNQIYNSLYLVRSDYFAYLEVEV